MSAGGAGTVAGMLLGSTVVGMLLVTTAPVAVFALGPTLVQNVFGLLVAGRSGRGVCGAR